MIPALIVGMSAGFGLWLLINSFMAPAPTSLSSALATMYSERPEVIAEDAGLRERLAGRLVKQRWVSDALTPIRADIGVTGMTEASFVSDLILRAIGFAVVAFLFALYVTSAGLTSPSPVVFVALPLVLAIGVAVATISELRKKAQNRRDEFLEAMVSFISFIKMAAGFSTLESATLAAIGAGAGWPFEALRAAVDDSQRRREDIWFGMERLGIQYDVSDLRELASTLKKGKSEGSSLMQSLTSRSTALQSRLLTLEVTRANKLTEVFTIPIMLIAISFVVFIGFPAGRGLFGI